MLVNVRFYGFVQDVVGPASLSVELPGRGTLRHLFDLLAERLGTRLRERLFNKAGELEPNVRVFIGDRQAGSLEESLGDGERSPTEVKVFVLSATAGG